MENMSAMCGECEEKETFDIMINERLFTMQRQGHSVSWESCKICLWEEKLSLCQALLVSSEINVLIDSNLCPGNF